MRNLLIIISMLMVHISFAQDIDELNLKAKNAYEQGEYKNAIKFSEQALEVIGENNNKSKPQYIDALNNLAYAQMSLGYFNESIHNFKLILTIYNKNGLNSIEYLEAVTNVAKIYNVVSKPDSVEIYYKIGMQLFEKSSQKNSRYYKRNINSFFSALVELKAVFASLIDQKGYTKEAIEHLEPVIEVIQSTFPGNYYSQYFYATLLNNIGNYYMELEDVGSASNYFLQYNAIIDENSKPAEYLQSLTNMGTLYSKQGNPDSAIYYWQKAIDWGNKKSLQTLTSYKSVLVNLGSELAYLEMYDSALFYLKKSLEIQNSHTGYDAYLYKNTLFNLAAAYNWSGKYKKANEIWRILLNRMKGEIQYNFSFLTEAEKRQFYQIQKFYYDNFANYCLEASGIIPDLQYSDSLYKGLELASDLYNNRVMTKGIILNSTQKMRKRILEGQDENIKRKFLDWIDMRYQLISMLAKSNSEIAEINQLQKEIEEMEVELSRNSDPFRKGFVFSDIKWQDIQKNLGPGEVAIETIRILNGLGYLALIITSETVDQPHLTVVLSGNNKFLEKERMSYYNNAVKFQLKDTLSYKIFMEPIIKEARQLLPMDTDITKIYFSADGIYHQINLNTLYNVSSKKYLIDEYDIVMMESTRFLALNEEKEGDVIDNSAFLVGNPSYTIDAQNATNYFSPLPGSETEVKNIANQLTKKYWKVKVNMGKDATTGSLKKISSPKILHIATHGFFIALDTLSENNTLLSLLLNSGLALVGINQNDNETREAGILRAYEATNLNLDNTELVVLSACESGLGNYYPGEGVYGLQKAFFTAGAKHIIMSLWKVDDEATHLLMDYFYTAYLEHNDMHKAFKTAQLKLRDKYHDPKYWGAFVLLNG